MADSDVIDRIRSAPDLQALDALRVSTLGKSGSITARLKSLGKMNPEERAAEAPKIHSLREAVTAAMAGRKVELENAELEQKLATERIDLSLPAPQTPEGSVHPVSQVMDELAEIFADLGFSVAEGPEIEEQWYN
ncbi:MAG: phenylalanine--tRNA ligase subunit alpha, partial [Sphingomonas sp.]|nr:phenylalanine--tRNA ligase subunit alpha [Sphingomonas sp.]